MDMKPSFSQPAASASSSLATHSNRGELTLAFEAANEAYELANIRMPWTGTRPS